MCIIIDTNCLTSVFDVDSQNHQDFAPILDWIHNGRGKIVYGGTKYSGELKKYLGIILQIRKAGKAVYIPDELVDQEEINVSSMIQHNDFDDQHLVALLRVSKCKLICSLDSRAYPYFRHTTFFNPAANKPKIYRSLGNSGLLCPNNIAEVCKPCENTTNAQRKIMQP